MQPISKTNTNRMRYSKKKKHCMLTSLKMTQLVATQTSVNHSNERECTVHLVHSSALSGRGLCARLSLLHALAHLLAIRIEVGAAFTVL